MKRPVTSQRGDRNGSPMSREPQTDIRDEDVTEANPVSEAAPRRLASRFEDRAVDNTEIDYGDFGQPKGKTLHEETSERGGRLSYGIDDNPAPPPRKAPVMLSKGSVQDTGDDEVDEEEVSEAPKPRRKPEDGASMGEIKARIEAKRQERNKREGRPEGGPERMVMKEFAQPDPVQKAQVSRPPLVDPNVPSAALKQIAEHHVFPSSDFRGEVPNGWIRQVPPSGCIPYDFDDLFVRPLEIPDLLGIHASVQNGSYTMFLDALNNAVNVDIRELTAADLRFLMYYWRINSYSRSPYTLTWTSRYGNENKTMIASESDLEIYDLEMTREEYESYRAKGIDFPRVRDAEYLNEITLSPTDRWMAMRAQYIATDKTGVDWYPSRFKIMRESGIELLELIRDFSKSIRHGIEERVKVTDSKYEPLSAINGLRSQAGYYSSVINSSTNRTPEDILDATERVEDYLDEADQIERTLAHIDMLENIGTSEELLPDGLTEEDLPDLKASLQPREESITLKISALDFFPEI